MAHRWGENIRLLLLCFTLSGLFTLTTYFHPGLRNVPIFGQRAAELWLWTLNPSPAYVGQGIIMGPETTLHMALGALIGWAFLSPLARHQGWAPGPVGDWDTGSKGWIVWVSLSIMLSDAIVSLGFISSRILLGSALLEPMTSRLRPSMNTDDTSIRYMRVPVDDDESIQTATASTFRGDHTNEPATAPSLDIDRDENEEGLVDAPADQQVSDRVIWVGLTASIIFCIASIHIVFGDLIPAYATVLAVAMALLLSVMGVRALGETDLNPVSGISKLAQLFFALAIPASNKATILINLISGAIVSPLYRLLKMSRGGHPTNISQSEAVCISCATSAQTYPTERLY